MLDSGYHIPVLMNTAVSYLINPLIKYPVIIDGTLGGGGYTEQILNNISENGRLISIDKDFFAIKHSEDKFKDTKNNLLIVKGNFADINSIIKAAGIDMISGIVLDLGLSSYQLNCEEGFSFLKDTRLDMRADKDSELTAYEIVNKYSENKLEQIFSEYGEISNSKRLAKGIVRWREKERIETTSDLVKAIQREYELKKEIPTKFFSKIFQALRIEVNDELSDLKKVLEESFLLMNNGGRIVVISYHSLEDRIVKEFFKSKNEGSKTIRILTKKVIKPEYQEIKNNKRARSAKLRAGEVQWK